MGMFVKELTFEDEIQQSADDGYEDTTTTNTRSWSVAWGDSFLSNDAHGGFRFQVLPFPRKSTVTSAVLKVTAWATLKTARDSDVYLWDTDDAPAWNAGTGPRSATPTTAQEQWSPASWTDNVEYSSPDITDPVQEVMERSGWSHGNDIGIILAPRISLGGAIMVEATAYDDRFQDQRANFEATAVHGGLGGYI